MSIDPPLEIIQFLSKTLFDRVENISASSLLEDSAGSSSHGVTLLFTVSRSCWTRQGYRTISRIGKTVN